MYKINKTYRYTSNDRRFYIMDEPLMTVEEVSVMLNISEQTIRRYIRSKELNAIKFKRSYRITRDDLNRFIKERYGR